MKQQLYWINTIKALCMIGVYILHTQYYLGNQNELLSDIISPFYVNAFFVVSGYLFFRKWLNISTANRPGGKDVKNLIFRLLIPTILFSSILYLPKLFFHSRGFSIEQYCWDVLGGTSFWFTSAMFVAQVILLLALFTGIRQLKVYIALSIIFVIALPFLCGVAPSPFPWYWKAGMCAVVMMTLGGIIYQYRPLLKSKIQSISIITLFSYILAVTYNAIFGNAHYAAMNVTFNLPGILVTAAGIALIFVVSYRWIPEIKLLQFIGRNSIIFYFFSGFIPASLSALPITGIFSGTIETLAVAFIAVLIGTVSTWVIVRYLPFLTDLRKVNNGKWYNNSTKNRELG